MASVLRRRNQIRPLVAVAAAVTVLALGPARARGAWVVPHRRRRLLSPRALRLTTPTPARVSRTRPSRPCSAPTSESGPDTEPLPWRRPRAGSKRPAPGEGWSSTPTSSPPTTRTGDSATTPPPATRRRPPPSSASRARARPRSAPASPGTRPCTPRPCSSAATTTSCCRSTTCASSTATSGQTWST